MSSRPFRFLNTAAASPPPVASNKASTAAEQVSPENQEFVVILAALLCALICVLGLISMARCAWLRRLSSSTAAPSPSSVANKGLKKKALRSLPKQSFTEDLAAKFTECAICLTEFSVGDEVRVLPQCGHGFHVMCIDTWLGSHSSCPSCRQILVVATCQKCGTGFPASSSNSNNDVRAAVINEVEEARLEQREDDPNRFLP